MLPQLVGIIFVLVLAATTGYLVGGVWGVITAALLVVLVYGVVLLWKIHRMERWLVAGNFDETPPWQSVWLEMAARVIRLKKQGVLQAARHEKRLEDFLLAIQASPNGVVLLHEDYRIDWCNETAELHLGLNAQKDKMQHIVHLVRDPVFAKYFAQTDHSAEVVIEGRTASVLQARKLAVQLHAYGDGRTMLLTRDITALTQSDAMRRDFVANVSHEIRTPLTVLSGFVETLQTLPLQAQEAQHFLQLMSVQADRMQSLVADLLTLSQLEGSQPPGLQEKVPLKALMAGVFSDALSLAELLASKGDGPVHQLTLEPLPHVDLLGSRSELLSAVSNLVSNAIRYTPLGGKIHLQWTVTATGASFAVNDSGPGIAAEHLPRLTERFYRVDRSRSRETGGTGLGLAITKHVMQRHGGELSIDSVWGKGSSFKLLLPASRVVVIEAPEARPEKL